MAGPAESQATFDAVMHAARACARARQLSSGERLFRTALEIMPGSVEARGELAMMLLAMGRVAEAQVQLHEALQLKPADARILYNLGVLSEQSGRRDEALAHYSDALAADPGHAAARFNRGALLLGLGDAASALVDFDAIAMGAQVPPEVQTNRARALFALFRDEEALGAAEVALAADPANARARMDRLLALASLGRLTEAQAARVQLEEQLGSQLEAFAGGAWHLRRLEPRAIHISRALHRQTVCDWGGRERLLEQLERAAGDELSHAVAEPGVLFYALGLPLQNETLCAIAAALAKAAKETAAALPAWTPRGPAKEGRIRVGFVSASLRRHPNSYLLRRLFADRDRSHFEYFLYGLAPDDGSEVRREVCASADRFLDASRHSPADALAALRADRLDLLVDTSTCMAGSRPELLAARAAPVQAAYLGMPAPLAGLVDYRFSDPYITPPEQQRHWTEALVLLPHTCFAYDNRTAMLDAGDRSAHGLPPRAFVLCAINQVFKIDPDLFSIWMRTLSAHSDAVLWLPDSGAVANANLRREGIGRGVAAERLIFAPNVPVEQHLGRLRHADLFVDTLNCNAHTTALDALWAGVPLLTSAGATMASRVAGSFLHGLGLGELVAQDRGEYADKLAMLAADRAALARLRARLWKARDASPVFDTSARVRDFERAVTAVVERARASLPPESVAIR
jgi:protein O-GlcNAc transferase